MKYSQLDLDKVADAIYYYENKYDESPIDAYKLYFKISEELRNEKDKNQR